MKNETMASAFNEWMRRFIDEPQRHAREFQSVARFLAEQSTGKPPTYGERSAAYLLQLSRELA